MVQYAPEIRETSVFADAPGEMLARKTRYEYLFPYLGLYKSCIRWKFYAIILGVLGVYFLFTLPPAAVICAFGVFYFHRKREWQLSRMNSSRKVIWNH